MKPLFKNKNNNEPALDIVLKVLEAAHAARPNATFISSLLQQYRLRGGLSKKQMEGLYAKASKIESIPASQIATLQAIILKKTTRHKSEATTGSIPTTNIGLENLKRMLDFILKKYPGHKQAILLHQKINAGYTLNISESEDIKRWYKFIETKG